MKHLLQATQIQAVKTKQSNTKCRDTRPAFSSKINISLLLSDMSEPDNSAFS